MAVCWATQTQSAACPPHNPMTCKQDTAYLSYLTHTTDRYSRDLQVCTQAALFIKHQAAVLNICIVLKCMLMLSLSTTENRENVAAVLNDHAENCLDDAAKCLQICCQLMQLHLQTLQSQSTQGMTHFKLQLQCTVFETKFANLTTNEEKKGLFYQPYMYIHRS